MWPKYIVIDDFLKKEHFDYLKNFKISNKDERITFKNWVIPRENKVISSKNYGKLLDDKFAIEFKDTYYHIVLDLMKKLNKNNISKFKYMEFTLVNTPKNFTFPIHTDLRDKLISIVIYISPEKNIGTWLYDNKEGKNPKQIEWKQNRAFIFCRSDNSWHNYKSDNINNRVALLINCYEKCKYDK